MNATRFATGRLAPTVLLSLLTTAPVVLAQGEGEGPATLTTAPAAAELTRFGSVKLATGVQVYYAERGSPANPPVVLIHGFTDSWFSFSRILPGLAKRYHVYALDQRGHGRSDQPEAGYGMTDLASDVVAFMDAMGIRKATVVGHSMGGFVAQQVVAAVPDRIDHLVLVGTGSSLGEIPGLTDFGAAVLALTDPVPVDFVREFQTSTIHHPVPSEFLEQVIAESRRLPARLWRALWEGMMSTPAAEDTRARSVPTLIVWGDRDAIIVKSAFDSMVGRYSHAKVMVYPETGHAPHWERPELFLRDLEAFLEKSELGVRG